MTGQATRVIVKHRVNNGAAVPSLSPALFTPRPGGMNPSGLVFSRVCTLAWSYPKLADQIPTFTVRDRCTRVVVRIAVLRHFTNNGPSGTSGGFR